MTILVSMASMGSPPQVRGIPATDAFVLSCAGITPAGAGHTEYADMYLVGFRDHPRRCGAYAVNEALNDISAGSPPQVRGIPLTCKVVVS